MVKEFVCKDKIILYLSDKSSVEFAKLLQCLK